MAKVVKLVRAGKYAAEVTIESIPDDGAWGPYLSLDDAKKLERVREALKTGDLKAAAREGSIFELVPIAPE